MNIYNKPGISLVPFYEDLWDLDKKNGTESILKFSIKVVLIIRIALIGEVLLLLKIMEGILLVEDTKA